MLRLGVVEPLCGLSGMPVVHILAVWRYFHEAVVARRREISFSGSDGVRNVVRAVLSTMRPYALTTPLPPHITPKRTETLHFFFNTHIPRLHKALMHIL